MAGGGDPVPVAAWGGGARAGKVVRVADDVERISPEVAGRLLSLLSRSDDVVGVTDDRGNVVWVNDATRKRLGIPADDPPALTTAELFPPEAFDVYFDQIRPALLRGEVWSGPVPLHLDDRVVDVDLVVVGGARPGGEIEWLACTGRSPGSRRGDAAAPGLHDELTGLAGRTLLTDRLQVGLRRSERDGRAIGVVFVDVDDLKVVNDELGHRAGDDLLVELSVRLRSAVRTSDTVARIGGDEFVVLLDGVTDDDEAVRLGERIRSAVASRPMELAGRPVPVSASVGITVARPGDDAETLVDRADTAMYRAKRQRHHADAEAAADRDDLAELAVAVTRQLVVPHLEPIAEVRSGRVVGHQALARWHRPEGVLAAADFVPATAGSGLAMAIDLAVLRRAAAAPALVGDLFVHASERLLLDPHVDRLLLEALERAGLEPERLRLGVADAALRRGGDGVHDAVRSLAGHGIGVMAVAVEEPTTALGERVGGPIGVVQLRRQLVAGVGADLDADRRVDAVVRHTHRRGASVLAVGVEHRSQLERLIELGCDLVEGHLIGPPVPIPAPPAST